MTTDSSLIKQHFNAAIFQSYCDYVSENYPHVDINNVCERAGLDLEYVMNENNWVSCVFNHRLMESFAEAISDPDFHYTVGRYAVSKRGLGSALYTLARNVFDIDYIYGNLWRLSSFLNKMMRFELVERSPRSVCLKITPLYAGLNEIERAALKESVPCIMKNIAGYYSALPRLKDMPDAAVEVRDLGDHFLFEIGFRPQTFRRMEAVGAGLLAVAAGAVAYAITREIPWTVTSSIMAIATYGSLVGRRVFAGLRSTADHLERNMEVVNDQYRRLQMTQEELDRKLVEATAHTAVATHLTASAEEQTVLKTIAQDLAEILGFDRVLVLLKNESETHLELRASHVRRGEGPDFLKGVEFEVDIGSHDVTKISNVFRHRRPILIRNVSEHLPTLNAESQRILRASGSKSFIAIPIASETDRFGVLIADNFQSDRRLTEADVQVLATAGRQLAIVLEKLRAQSRLSGAYTEIEGLAKSYSRFVPFELIDLIGYDSVVDIDLKAGKEYEMAVVFSDIRNFTSLSEQMDPAQTVAFLNSYFSNLAPVFEAHGGVIDKFVGDGIMALFLDPRAAVRAANEFQAKLAQYNAKHRSGGRKRFISAGVGIHYGKVILGAVGYEGRMSISVTSDAVNVASRIEGLTKTLGVDMLCTAEVAAQLPGPPGARFVGKIKVKGRQAVTEIYEVLEHLGEAEAKIRREAEPGIRSLVSLIEANNSAGARMLLEALVLQFPADPVLVHYDEVLSGNAMQASLYTAKKSS